MAGSAGSPHVVTVYVCDRCKLPTDAVVAANAGSPICQDFDHITGGQAVPVEYVPREQSDALLTALKAIAQRMPHGTVTDENWCAVVEMAEEADAVLDSYREATAGEDETNG